MIARRDLLIGSASLGAAGLAYYLQPRQRQNLLSGARMADILPLRFGTWSAENADGLVQPKSEDELAAQLYSEMVGRIYSDSATGEQVMMLVAYGDTQSDLLQLHRPEACYPAVGFNLVESKVSRVQLTSDVVLPVRRVVATAPGRQENIVYWARIGDYLPASGNPDDRVDGERRIADGHGGRGRCTAANDQVHQEGETDAARTAGVLGGDEAGRRRPGKRLGPAAFRCARQRHCRT